METLSRFFKLRKGEKDTFYPNDRRSTKRYDLQLKLTYSDPANKSLNESLTRNISRSGLRFSLNKKIPKGTLLDIKVEDPFGNTLVSSRAKVTWVEEFIAGDDAEDMIYETGVRLIKKTLY